MSNPASPLLLQGPLVIQTIRAQHARLVQELADRPACDLDLGGVTEIDAFGLQVLVAVRKSAQARHQPFSLGTVPGAVADQARRLGLSLDTLLQPE